MPLQKLQLKPGINRESTALANEGTWFEMDKVRFRSGYPEKIGGWVKDTGSAVATATLLPPTGAYWGIARAMRNWTTLAGSDLLGIGTELKYSIQQSVNGNFYDVTPLRSTQVVAANAFTTTNGLMTVVVNAAGHGAVDGDFVTISGVGGPVNGIPAASLNREFRLTYLTSGTFQITVDTPATSTATAGACTLTFQINTGAQVNTTASGWGAGGWGGNTSGVLTGWGQAAASGVTIQLRQWSQASYGQDLIINPRGGPLYLWKVDASPTVFNRAVLLSSTSASPYTTDTSCPTVCNTVAVSAASRFVVAFGCNEAGSTVLDPMLIRWGDQESYATWIPSASNQAGSYRLTHGSQIITAVQTRQEFLVLTDIALYSFQYVGPPYVWNAQYLAENISVMGPNVTAAANNSAYWMGVDKFYVYTGRVETLHCPLRQYIFGDINLSQKMQFFGCTNEGYNEIWWFYCSANSSTIDRYVLYNYLEKTWSYGTMARTAWIDSSTRGLPIGAGYNGQIIYHESGVDDGSVTPAVPITSYIQSADFNIGDGHNYGFVWRMVPDITFDGSYVNNPSVTFTLRPRQNPGAPYSTSDTPTITSTQNFQNQRNYTVQEFTQLIYVRARGRQMAFKVSSTGLGVSWQMGVPSIDVRPDGRR